MVVTIEKSLQNNYDSILALNSVVQTQYLMQLGLTLTIIKLCYEIVFNLLTGLKSIFFYLMLTYIVNVFCDIGYNVDPISVHRNWLQILA